MQYVKKEGAQGICPVGWHIPAASEMFVLQEYLGGHGEAGGKMKEQGNSHWCSPNIGATDSSGFTALPDGKRDTSGYFSYRCSYAFFWASTQSNFDSLNAYSGLLWYQGSFFQVQPYDDRKLGFSVRCIMNK